ncbi:hypothetical protein ACTHQ4_16455 [Alkalicoccobacillus gibsonii]|uniref:hypothetical protein n=1 Tax=Alkalicoccobacillus gibsonii TaxID=79881 RepID=UPI003F7C9FFE
MSLNFDKINEMYTNLNVSEKSGQILINYKKGKFTYNISELNVEDIDAIFNLMEIIEFLVVNYREIEFVIHDEDCILINFNENHYEINPSDWSLDELKQLLNIVEYVKYKSTKVKVNIKYETYISLSCEEWTRDATFGIDFNNDNRFLETFRNIRSFFELANVEGEVCFSNNYVEFPIISGETIDWYDFNLEVNSNIKNYHTKGINYEISKISEFFWNKSLIHQKAEYLENYEKSQFITLKVFDIEQQYNINTVNNLEKAFEIAKNILFKLSHQYDIIIDLTSIPNFDDESYLDDHYNNLENLNKVDEHFILKLYDYDLVNYYHRANHMENSQFKFLAFYQVLECIFDEVHLSATVQDIKQVLNSDWFSKQDDNDITQLIDLVNIYNKKRNDKDKLKLVLEKYFKGEANDKAFYISNKSVIEILKKINKLNKDQDLKDLQKLSETIYDFRCYSTHSNREFPIKKKFVKENDDLVLYIELIKKISEKIIVNYYKI